jgi:hypothetical protein
VSERTQEPLPGRGPGVILKMRGEARPLGFGRWRLGRRRRSAGATDTPRPSTPFVAYLRELLSVTDR